MTDLPLWTALAAAPLLFAACSPPDDSGASAKTDAALDRAVANVRSIEIPQAGASSSAPAAQSTTGATDEALMARAIMANPAAYKPETYVYVTKYLWERGDRQQAAFWHYLFQIRTLPWLQFEPQMAPFRSAVNASLGKTINEWLGSDFGVFIDTTARALSYERRIPLSPERPAGVSEAQWAEAVARTRASWQSDFEETTGPGGPTREQMDAQRRANGLYVGPLRDPGAPLPDDWR